VFVPTGKNGIFLKKITEYAEQTTPKGSPKHNKLWTSVRGIRRATLESMWRDDLDLIPQNDVKVLCEIWLRVTDKNYLAIEKRFREIAAHIGIEVELNKLLCFPELLILLVRASYDNLCELIEESPDLAEIRRAKKTARDFLELENKVQAARVEALKARLNITDTNVAVCILDTGVNNGHPLLAPVLRDEDCHTINPDWGTADRGGHGTLMCGTATFGDIVECLSSEASIIVKHRLESVKILPNSGKNDPDMYGYLTIQAISRAETQAPERIRIGCMAVSTEDGRDKGRPTSWSAAIDKLSSGYDDSDDGNRRLMIVSAGNVAQSQWSKYPKSNTSYSIHDPGQSWNALTVGSITTKCFLSDENLGDCQLLAQPNQLSPFSSTSCSWEKNKWPIKPEIVLEGGNLLQDPDGLISNDPALSLLSTGHQPRKSLFDSINATSASTALAARMAAQVQARYPDAWPETIRALLVHTADWSEERQLLPVNENGESNRGDYRKLLRSCGYGLPNFNRALESAANSLTMISEAKIQPYKKRENSSGYATKHMHLYQLPWPKEELLQLGEISATLRITLSYFVEPSPGERGWKDRYRYQSYGLRFDVNRSRESLENFEVRLNKAALAEEDENVARSGDSRRWTIGAQTRDVGSIHSDRWKGTAAQLATCNYIGVYPVIGWWRERHWLGRWNEEARYSLIVSIETPSEEVDIYTPVTFQPEIRIIPPTA